MQRTLLWLLPLAAISLSAQTRITITLYDTVNLDSRVRETMKSEAARILLEAGVAVEWLECEIAGKPLNFAACSLPLGPARLMFQLVAGENRANPKASGMAVIQGEASVAAWLYVDRVRTLARDAGWPYGDLLAHAACHETGHLLLRSTAHSPAGVMRAKWETEDLRKLTHTALTFLPGQLTAVLAAKATP